MLISLIDIFLIASGIAGWLVIVPLWMWRRRHDKAHAQPHLPTLDELEARAAVAAAKAAEARRCHTPLAPAQPRAIADDVWPLDAGPKPHEPYSDRRRPAQRMLDALS